MVVTNAIVPLDMKVIQLLLALTSMSVPLMIHVMIKKKNVLIPLDLTCVTVKAGLEDDDSSTQSISSIRYSGCRQRRRHFAVEPSSGKAVGSAPIEGSPGTKACRHGCVMHAQVQFYVSMTMLCMNMVER